MGSFSSRKSSSFELRSIGLVAVRETIAEWWPQRSAREVTGRVLLLVGSSFIDHDGTPALDQCREIGAVYIVLSG